MCLPTQVYKCAVSLDKKLHTKLHLSTQVYKSVVFFENILYSTVCCVLREEALLYMDYHPIQKGGGGSYAPSVSRMNLF